MYVLSTSVWLLFVFIAERFVVEESERFITFNGQPVLIPTPFPGKWSPDGLHATGGTKLSLCSVSELSNLNECAFVVFKNSMIVVPIPYSV